MAQELSAGVAAPQSLGGLLRASGALKGLRLMPANPSQAPVVYTPRLVAYVAVVSAVAVGLGAWLVRPPIELATVLAGGVTTFLMARFAVRSPGVPTTWSPSVFLHLGMSITLGPSGALLAAAAEALGLGLRSRNGWFRTVFNFANTFLADLAAWLVFMLFERLSAEPGAFMAAGLLAALSQFFVNHALVAGVLILANPHLSLAAIVRHDQADLPYSIGYGVAAFAFVIMHREAGALGFTALVVPVILLQVFLIVFAIRSQAYEEQRAAHQREREGLLQKAVDASESERRRIARDLHDGVVQNLAGMAYTLMATATKLREKGGADGKGDVVSVLEQSAEETRLAMKDLRTLIIEIAPPTLRREGLHAALLEVLRTLRNSGTKTSLELPSNMRLRPDRASLVFRVAQEVLRNVASHAEAKHVSVVLKEDDGEAVLRIVDDGKGFSAEDVARRRAEGHVGTNAIVELAEEVGGSLTIESERGKGTSVTLIVPTE